MDDAKFFACRDAVLETLKAHGVDSWSEAIRILASAMNEKLSTTGELAVVTLRPLVAYREVENKI